MLRRSLTQAQEEQAEKEYASSPEFPRPKFSADGGYTPASAGSRQKGSLLFSRSSWSGPFQYSPDGDGLTLDSQEPGTASQASNASRRGARPKAPRVSSSQALSASEAPRRIEKRASASDVLKNIALAAGDTYAAEE